MITRVDEKKINDGCANGFVLDFFHTVMNGEKTLIKEIEISETEMIRARLLYRAEYKQCVKVGVTPILNISRLTKRNSSDTFYNAHTLFEIVQGETVSRKNMKKLQEYTRRYDDETILGLVKDNEGKKQVKTRFGILDIA